MEDEKPLLCRHCTLPIRPGDPRWAAHEPDEFWHYECAEKAGLGTSSPAPIPTRQHNAP
jgi:hypothetical protein